MLAIWCWLDEEEVPSGDAQWEELDMILSMEIFESLTGVFVRYVYRDHARGIWLYSSHFEKSEFYRLLPRLHKRGIPFV